MIDDEEYVCEAWVSETKLNLHQNDCYGVIGVAISSILQEMLPFVYDDIKRMESVIELATRELVEHGVPFELDFNQGIYDPDGSLATLNLKNRKMYKLEEAEGRDAIDDD